MKHIKNGNAIILFDIIVGIWLVGDRIQESFHTEWFFWGWLLYILTVIIIAVSVLIYFICRTLYIAENEIVGDYPYSV